MKFDDILKEVGEFGPYQKFVYFLVCLTAITCGIHAVIAVFIVGVPRHRCAIPGLENDTYAIQNDFHAELINITIPVHLEDGSYVYDECSVFVYNTSHVTDGETATQLCDSWVYDGEIFSSNAVTTMDLVCSQKLYRSHITMAFMAGNLVGSLIPGVLADIFGRKAMLLVGCALQLTSGVATGWMTNYALLAFVRFCNGVAGMAMFINAFTIGVELVGPSKRRLTGIVIEYMFTFGELILAGVAYLLRDWTYLQLAVSLPSVFFISYWWILPESPRWLNNKGRQKEAREIIERIARANKRHVTEEMFSDDDNGFDNKKNSDRLWHLCMSTTMLKRTLIIFFNWFVISMAYYGLSLNSGNLVGSIYLNFFLTALVEIPAETFCILFLDRVGRKPLHMAAMIVGGVACTCTIFTVLYAGRDYQWTTTALALIGKMGVSAAFVIIFIYTSEVFPTSVRNGGLGSASTISRVGSMLSPYIANLGVIAGGQLRTAMPLLIFGLLSLVAGFLSVFLPETFNRKLPDSVSECEQLGRTDVLTRNANIRPTSYDGVAMNGQDGTDVKLRGYSSIPWPTNVGIRS